MAIEETVFFVKPHDVFRSKDIFAYLTHKLTNGGRFNLDYRGMMVPSKEFYEMFYSDLKYKNPEAFKRVMKSYPNKFQGRIVLSLVSGEDIIQRVKTIQGPTMFGENPDWTIRGKFGPYELPNTICHASGNSEEVNNEKYVLKRFKLI